MRNLFGIIKNQYGRTSFFGETVLGSDSPKVFSGIFFNFNKRSKLWLQKLENFWSNSLQSFAPSGKQRRLTLQRTTTVWAKTMTIRLMMRRKRQLLKRMTDFIPASVKLLHPENREKLRPDCPAAKTGRGCVFPGSLFAGAAVL